MSFKRFLIENNARTVALKKQQELIDYGEHVKVTKYGDIYELESNHQDYWACTPKGATLIYQPITYFLDTAKGAYDLACKLEYKLIVGEPVIAKDCIYSYFYALEVLKAPFPAGEEAIAKNGYWASLYASNVLKKRFLAGEKIILADEHYAPEYRKRWGLTEDGQA